MNAKRIHFPNIRRIDTKRRKLPPAPTKRERLAAWRNFLLTDDDSSWETVLEVLDFKLGRLERSIKYGHGADRQARVVEIRTVRDLVRRVLANAYEDDLWAPYRKKYGNSIMRFEDSKDKNGLSTLVFEYTKAKTDTAQIAAKRSFGRIAKKAATARQRDIEKLFLLIARDLQIWWD